MYRQAKADTIDEHFMDRVDKIVSIFLDKGLPGSRGSMNPSIDWQRPDNRVKSISAV